MTSFFVAGIEPRDDMEVAYAELRRRSQRIVGCPPRSRRIFKLGCRLEGRDCEIEVGRELPDGSDVVAAILDHGREEAFAVHTVAEVEAPTRVGRPVYSVTDFS